MGKQLPGNNNNNHELAKKIDEISRRLSNLENKEKQKDKVLVQHGRELQDIKEEYPLLPPEADDLSKAVKRKGVEILGGKKSRAYKNKEIRTKVYRDIYGEVKRQYGLSDEQGRQQSYKKLKRKYFKGALLIVDGYEAPVALYNDIEAENELGDDDDEG